MKTPSLLTILPLVLSLATTSYAQTVDTLGGTTTPATRANTSKASMFRVDTSAILFNIEFYLDVPGPETLTFFMLRHHSRTGIGTLLWTNSVNVNGTGVGPAWYSSGQIALPVLAGNHYLLGVAWPGSLTYYYSIGTATGTPVAFGAWVGAKTPGNPPPQTLNFTGFDAAQYHQRITSIPTGFVTRVGTGCAGSATLAPRLVASEVLRIGTQPSLQVVDATANVPAVFALGVGPTLPVALTLFGCEIWLSNVFVSIPINTSAAGEAALPLAIPADPSLSGLRLSVQSMVVGTTPGFTNALELSVN